ncbi:LuxR family two component transcriptional regulator [Paraperlucidibaca baekdonensis]|uniref:LuxR family two component transcriptional regulator n=1 Tax=Paraperlucidibaca baekdonensis TaxID=748120 RepID=A0A3E0H5R5_9GAMM|nr:response regulator transcription factor [Paraperlucidibaca baekdonensis]REH38892.1 LuxR family two component transcriptional regulator [Paraperlucidibaca baekdonensis]
MPLTVAIVDSHPVLSHGLAALLEPVPGLAQVTVITEHAALISALRQDLAQVVLLGITDTDPLLFDTALCAMRQPHQPKVALMNQCPSVSPQALIDAGVSAFVSRQAGLDELVKALSMAAMAQRYVSPELAQAWLLSTPSLSAGDQPFAALSEREWEVLRYLLADKRVQEIATALSLSPKTVSTYRSRLMEKLGVQSDMALLRLAQAAGLCA